jgi:hypothetical protein
VSDERVSVVALLSDLVKAVAKVEGMEEVRVGLFARAAREANLITQKGRGRGAAHMSVEDAANLLIAVNACALAKEVSSKVPIYRDLRLEWRHEDWIDTPAVRDITSTERSLGEEIAFLIELALPEAGGPSPLAQRLEQSYRKADAAYAAKWKVEFPSPEFEIEFTRPNPWVSFCLVVPAASGRKAKQNTMFARYEICKANYAPAYVDNRRGDTRDRRETTVITDRTLTEVARVLFA